MRGMLVEKCMVGVLLLVPVGCSGSVSGEETGAGGGAAGAATGGSGGGSAGTAGSPTGGSGGTGGEVSYLVGTWEGYVENFQLPSGSDRVTITFSVADETSGVQGTVVFGTASAPPVDPNVGYPPGIDPYQIDETIVEGFVFDQLAGTLSGKRIRFEVAVNTQWTQWCEMQTSYSDAGGSGAYSCVPNWPHGTSESCWMENPDTGERIPIDCGKLALCQSQTVCRCAAAGCSVEPISKLTFDLSFATNTGDGSVGGLIDGVGNVRLTRAE